ncbi:Fis family transcriptional regulator [Marinomonas epiphytica]
MRKTDKKLDKAIIEVLNQVCNQALDQVPGFCWLTHRVDYQDFPNSLNIICIFDTNQDMTKARQEHLIQLIEQALKKIQITFKHVNKHIQFDSEESCLLENNGRWKERLS